MPEAKPSETREQRDARLNETDRGRALLSVINEFGGNLPLAKKLGVTANRVGMWVHRGFMSMRGASDLAELTGRERSEFRPDLSDADWDRAFAGPVPGKKPECKTADSRLLVELAEKYGSVSKLCEKAYISVGDFHTWKSRGKIPAIKLTTMLMLQRDAL
jgi:hypothetical protein